MHSLKLSVLALVSFPLATASAQECTQVLLQPPSTFAYGTAVDIDGTQGAASAIVSSAPYTTGGVVFLYEQDPVSQAFAEVGFAQASDLDGADQFGHRVKLDGDVLAVANVLDTINGLGQAGSVYVFERNLGMGGFEEVQKLSLATAAFGDDFGQDIALDGERLAVGVPERGGAGAVYVYQRNSGTGVWELEQEILAIGTTGPGVDFGYAVALEGERLMIGARQNGPSGSGGVIVMERNSGTGNWDYLQTLSPSVVQSQNSGYSIALEGDRMVTGAPLFTSAAGSNHGRAYVFERDSGTGLWSESAVLQAATLDVSDLAGQFVALQGDEAFVAAVNKERAGTTNRGVVHRFLYDSGTQAWNEIAAIEPPNIGASFFGRGLAIDGPVIALGAPAGSERSAYFRHALSPDCNSNGIPDICEITAGAVPDFDGDYLPDSCEALGFSFCSPAVPNSTGVPGRTFALGSTSATANDFFLYSTDLPNGQFAFYLVSQGTTIISMPGGSQGDLCIAGAPIGRFNQVENILQVPVSGQVELSINTNQIAQPTGPVAVMAGETWYFQLWHREQLGGPSSNFTDARGVMFQ